MKRTSKAGQLGRRWRRRLGLACASVIAAALAFEGLARWLGPRGWRSGWIPDLTWADLGVREPRRGWALRPGLRARMVGPHDAYDVETDATGYRQASADGPRAADELRVMALGDSVTFGWGVEREERYPELLAQALALRTGRSVRLANLAVPGYSIDQSLWTYERDGVPWNPDIVVLCTVLNDVAGANQGRHDGKAKPALSRRPDGGWERVEPPPEQVVPTRLPAVLRWSSRSAAVAWVRGWVEPRRALPPLQEQRPWDASMARQLDTMLRDLGEQYGDPGAPIHEALRRLAERVAAGGATFVVVCCPFAHDPHLVDPRLTAPPEGRRESVFSATVREQCRALGIRCVSVDEAFARQVERGERLHVGDGHPNALGHRLIAGVLTEELAR